MRSSLSILRKDRCIGCGWSRLSDSEHRLFITLHHIIFDGVSLYRVLLPELQTLYEAFTTNQSPALAELPIQYPDYAVWQRDSIKEIPPEHLSYWQRICDDIPMLDLQTDRPRPASQTYAGAMATFRDFRADCRGAADLKS